MIKRIELKDVTIFEEFEWEGLSNVNVVIGENDTGKSNLLRMMYAVARSLEGFTRFGDAAPSGRWEEVLAKKLRWTFQPPGLELGRLVRKGKQNRLEVKCYFESAGPVEFSFGPSTTKEIQDASFSQIGGPFVRTLFFPPKEVLTTLQAIAATREQLQIAGFGDTYYDLITALRQPESHGEVDAELKPALKELDSLFKGRVHHKGDGDFEYRRGSERYGMTQTAEGIKKISSLAQLVRSRQIQKGSILFFDEPSANLHPRATLDVVELLFKMTRADIQIFIATHSYEVLKQLEILAREHEESVPLCVLTPSEENGVTAEYADLRDRIPSNSIVQASVELFERDLDLSMDQSK